MPIKPLCERFARVLSGVDPASLAPEQIDRLARAVQANGGFTVRGRWLAARLLSGIDRPTRAAAMLAALLLDDNPIPEHACGVKYYSQYDKRWAQIPYFSDPDGTIGTDGCWITSMAMAAAGNGSVTPSAVNADYLAGADPLRRRLAGLGGGLGLKLRSVMGGGGADTACGDTMDRLLESVFRAVQEQKIVMLGLRLDKAQTGWARHTTLAVGLTKDVRDLVLFDSVFGPITWSVYRETARQPEKDNEGRGTAVLGIDLADAFVPPAGDWWHRAFASPAPSARPAMIPTRPTAGQGKRDRVTESAPAEVMRRIHEYFHLQVDGIEFKTPYYSNVIKARARHRSRVGKGTPREIQELAVLCGKQRGFSFQDRTPAEARAFLRSQGIGVDCSGYIAHLLDRWLAARGQGSLARHILFPGPTLAHWFRSLVCRLRPIENAGANLLTGPLNTHPVPLADVRPGDLIRLKKNDAAYHVGLVLAVTGFRRGRAMIPTTVEYTHSSSNLEDHGVRVSTLKITDLSRPLHLQDWSDSHEDGQSWSELLSRDDCGFRRPKFFSLAAGASGNRASRAILRRKFRVRDENERSR